MSALRKGNGQTQLWTRQSQDQTDAHQPANMAPRSTYFINPALSFLAASPGLPSAGYGAGVLLERAEASRTGCTLGDRTTHRIDNARLACSGKLRQVLTVALLHSTAVLMVRRKRWSRAASLSRLKLRRLAVTTTHMTRVAETVALLDH